ncbi:MAG: 50S ribosomal protein L17 [Patescibacteria group bacterium]|mgnify:CR=1 FL=1
MKHKHGNRILSRVAADRRQLLSNLAGAVLRHGSIVTSEAKGKELKKFLEPLITKARKGTSLHVRRKLLSSLFHQEDVERLFAVARANAERAGGYLRLTRLPARRGDDGQEVRVDIIDTEAKE